MKLVSAVFYTNDLDRVADFYTEKLGFKMDYKREDRFASFVFENGIKLGVKKRVEEREVPGSQTVFIEVEDIEAKYQEMKDKGVEIYKALVEEAWGWEFSILDPDGNKVQFTKRS